MANSASLVCVSLGMKLAAHISPVCRAYVKDADIVILAASSGLVEVWLKEINPEVKTLHHLYQEGKSRLETYQQMFDIIMGELRQGKRVCAAFYGHAGVFAMVPHKVIKQAKKEGISAHMEPGISAEDCLYADLSIDPGKYGCQHYEASQFLTFKRIIDPSAYLILWQIGITGDSGYDEFQTSRQKIQLLVDKLLNLYPFEHEVILYKSGLYSFENSFIEPISLGELASAEPDLHTTLVIKPVKSMTKDDYTLEKLNAIS